MSVTAKMTNTGLSAKKLKHIVDLVRGKNVEEAMQILQFLPSPAAAQVAKVVKSAAANAENELLARTSDLRITEIYAGQDTSLKRFRARARGRVARILKRSSKITVVVDEAEAV